MRVGLTIVVTVFTLSLGYYIHSVSQDFFNSIKIEQSTYKR